ncbi:MAG: DUF167 domain-containing protein [Rhodospirillales bacterium]|nr:DUF167 domain-containing protein [Rhodospirillales bacterium]
MSATIASPVSGGLRLAVRLTPKSSADRLLGIVTDDAGRPALKVAVTAAPEAGKANAALEKLLAKALGLPRTTVSVVSGHTNRSKLVHLAGDPPDLLARIERVLGEQG